MTIYKSFWLIRVRRKIKDNNNRLLMKNSYIVVWMAIKSSFQIFKRSKGAQGCHFTKFTHFLGRSFNMLFEELCDIFLWRFLLTKKNFRCLMTGILKQKWLGFFLARMRMQIDSNRKLVSVNLIFLYFNVVCLDSELLLKFICSHN